MQKLEHLRIQEELQGRAENDYNIGEDEKYVPVNGRSENKEMEE